MGVLDRFERGVENVVNAAFSRSSRSGIKPIELASALRKEADAKAASVDRTRTVAPNEYDIRLGVADYATVVEWGDDALAQEFEDTLHQHAELQRYVFVGSVSVRFIEDDILAPGRFVITSRSTRSPAMEATGATRTRVGPSSTSTGSGSTSRARPRRSGAERKRTSSSRTRA